jgi:hypothetical protein
VLLASRAGGFASPRTSAAGLWICAFAAFAAQVMIEYVRTISPPVLRQPSQRPANIIGLPSCLRLEDD